MDNSKQPAGDVARRGFLKTIGIFGGSTLLSPLLLAATNAAPLQQSTDAGYPKIPCAGVWLQPIGLNTISVGGEIGRRIRITIHNNLLALDPEQFLAPFRNRDLRGEGYSDYIGLGKQIDATVRLAAYSKDEKVIALKKKLIDGIISTQEADGYIGVMVKESRMWKLWDIHEMGYIIMGLSSDYLHFGEQRSLKAARNLASYIMERWATMPPDWEKWKQLGIESNILSLYHVTKDHRYLDFCVNKLKLPEWKIDLTVDTLGKSHMYTDIDLCLAQLDLYELQQQEQLLDSSRRAINFLTQHNGMVITGAAGLWESWNSDQGGRQYLGETCATAYQLRLLDRFIRMEGDSRYGDVMERIIVNALFGAQSPDGRKLRYFMPMEGNRVYFQPDTYCCPNNFRRIISELPTYIFYRTTNGVAVNLYTTADATIALDKNVILKIRQQTDYPSTGNVVISIDPSTPAHFPLQLRIPGWCRNATIKVNGKEWSESANHGRFLSIDRQWNKGDTVSLDLDMPFRLVLGRVHQSGHVAVMRGPQVFCLNPSQHEQLKEKDAADLTNFIIDPASLKLIPDDSITTGGVACSVKVGDRVLHIGTPMQLKFTPFPDPDGRVVYFRIPDFSVAVPDEIVKGDCCK
ncbi:beta-L-arabinofuranosidase domain-containing protein [Flavihumibacter fluvii]|uniref:beta-L-arabinofuranosidase domain-containing protein n=1 Tax=Flavihumibacter fluvii TaxID=2838157 RepID=UPI001BDE52AF|nr:beta-L-arabinofuranosidase domain-containing protein [Flavihumibacter fluvii]ULQ51965.1 glycoside hydrolase family 127 protein [Flavihumibacter fluvii]